MIDQKILDIKSDVKRHRSLMSLVQNALGLIVQDRTDHYEECSERWQESEVGEAYAELTSEVEEVLEMIEGIEI